MSNGHGRLRAAMRRVGTSVLEAMELAYGVEPGGQDDWFIAGEIPGAFPTPIFDDPPQLKRLSVSHDPSLKHRAKINRAAQPKKTATSIGGIRRIGHVLLETFRDGMYQSMPVVHPERMKRGSSAG